MKAEIPGKSEILCINPCISHKFEHFIWGDKVILDITAFNIENLDLKLKIKYINKRNSDSSIFINDYLYIMVIDGNNIFRLSNIIDQVLFYRGRQDRENRRVVNFSGHCYIANDRGKSIRFDNSYDTDYGDRFLDFIFPSDNDEMTYRMDEIQMEKLGRILYNLFIHCGYDISNRHYDAELVEDSDKNISNRSSGLEPDESDDDYF